MSSTDGSSTDDSSTGGSNTGGSGTGGSGAGGSAPTGPSVTDITAGLKQIAKSGPADVKLSTETRDKYLNIIRTFKASLQDEFNKMKTLGTTNKNVSKLASAIQTQQNLDGDVHSPVGLLQAISNYIDLLEECETTVSKACSRLIQHG